MQDKARKVAWLASLGAGLEYYDFIIYGMMASYLSPLFFPSDESWMGLLKVFGVFAIGYGVRPLGGMFFGMLGDIYGRKHTFFSCDGFNGIFDPSHRPITYVCFSGKRVSALINFL